MQPKDYVVSLEVAKKLKDYLPKGFRSFLSWEKGSICLIDDNMIDKIDFYRAPNSDEMLAILPEDIYELKKTIYASEVFPLRLHIDFSCLVGKVCYRRGISVGYFELMHFIFRRRELATALAKLYMWLVDNKYIEVTK